MLIPFRQQNPHTQKPPQPLSNPRRLNKLIVALHQHLTQRLGACHQHPAFIEKPAIIQHAVVGHVVDPVPLRLARWVAEDAWEVTEEGVAALGRLARDIDAICLRFETTGFMMNWKQTKRTYRRLR